MNCTDIPYLEDLVFYLKNNPVIQECFPSIGSVKLSIGPEGIEEMLEDDCPYDKCIIIYPGGSRRIGNLKTNTCPTAEQVLSIAIVRKCNGKHFEFEKDGDGQLALGGDYMDLACMRKKLIEEMKCFSSDGFIDMWWTRTFETTSTKCLLITGIEYGLTYGV